MFSNHSWVQSIRHRRELLSSPCWHTDIQSYRNEAGSSVREHHNWGSAPPPVKVAGMVGGLAL